MTPFDFYSNLHLDFRKIIILLHWIFLLQQHFCISRMNVFTIISVTSGHFLFYSFMSVYLLYTNTLFQCFVDNLIFFVKTLLVSKCTYKALMEIGLRFLPKFGLW